MRQPLLQSNFIGHGGVGLGRSIFDLFETFAIFKKNTGGTLINLVPKESRQCQDQSGNTFVKKYLGFDTNQKGILFCWSPSKMGDRSIFG